MELDVGHIDSVFSSDNEIWASEETCGNEIQSREGYAPQDSKKDLCFGMV